MLFHRRPVATPTSECLLSVTLGIVAKLNTIGRVQEVKSSNRNIGSTFRLVPISTPKLQPPPLPRGSNLGHNLTLKIRSSGADRAKFCLGSCWEVMGGLSCGATLCQPTLPDSLPRGADSSYKCIQVVGGFAFCLAAGKYTCLIVDLGPAISCRRRFLSSNFFRPTGFVLL